MWSRFATGMLVEVNIVTYVALDFIVFFLKIILNCWCSQFISQDFDKLIYNTDTAEYEETYCDG